MNECLRFLSFRQLLSSHNDFFHVSSCVLDFFNESKHQTDMLQTDGLFWCQSSEGLVRIVGFIVGFLDEDLTIHGYGMLAWIRWIGWEVWNIGGRWEIQIVKVLNGELQSVEHSHGSENWF
ncbi:hypothetical protein GCK72_012768 [Caenorhabditis remanei]|uniref:Uncharacterized protein n=1 Tax=Caenorhabditis remanei TaxID=31234 RepID=A0A6A5GP45_CAERE|nr:hypothetical protein GCK72_012768 [Caenorhabditis remanei]KAF1756315.1 hypothetical protein GCK72_012768 [Caenorhabditis remanei]